MAHKAKMDYTKLSPAQMEPTGMFHVRSTTVRKELNIWIENHPTYREAVKRPNPPLHLFLMILHQAGMRYYVSQDKTWVRYYYRQESQRYQEAAAEHRRMYRRQT